MRKIKSVLATGAAVGAVGGGTAGEVTTNYTDNGYEVTVRKSNGSKVEFIATARLMPCSARSGPCPAPWGRSANRPADGVTRARLDAGPRQLPYGKKQIPDSGVEKPQA